MMRNAFLAAAMFVSLCFAGAAAAQEAEKPSEAAVPAAPAAGPRPHITYLDKSKVIYITDFSAGVETGPASDPASNDGPIDPGSMGSPQLNGTDNGAAGSVASGASGAGRTLADDLLRDLKKAGYKTKFLGVHDPAPEEGILLAGVFTQTGNGTELRRVVLGAIQVNGDVQVYVTTANLLRTAKPLYEPVRKGLTRSIGAEPIRLNPEVATLKFVMTANPDAKAIKKTAEQIVAELERLTLQAEAQGLAGAEDPINKYSKP
jgi:hypothetical protein